jgi:hypothetical protein
MHLSSTGSCCYCHPLVICGTYTILPSQKGFSYLIVLRYSITLAAFKSEGGQGVSIETIYRQLFHEHCYNGFEPHDMPEAAGGFSHCQG